MKYIKKIKIILFVAIFLLLSGCTNINNNIDTQPLSKTEFMMDTVITVKIYNNKDKSIFDKVFNRIKEIENRMSNTIEKSDINMVNKNAGISPVKVHDDVYYVLKKAKYYAEITNGAYDPTIGPLVDLWDINNRGKNKINKIPEKEKINDKKNYVDYNKLELLANNEVFLKEKGMKIDLGGIVKGYTADEIKKILLENKVDSAILDLGGNLYAVGGKQTQGYWNIGIQNPFEERGNYIGIVKVKDKSIVTSGNYERYFEVDGKRYHHIIDSKTGYPSDNQLVGVSIITKDSIEGDALSTALFVLGIDNGIKLINKLDDAYPIFISKNNKIYIPSKMKENFSLKNLKFELITNKF